MNDKAFESKVKLLEEEIKFIKSRNKRVEADKAWETSFFRIGLISFLIYIVASTGLYFMGVVNYLESAFIPTIGYFLSTQSIPFVKKWWVQERLNKND